MGGRRWGVIDRMGSRGGGTTAPPAPSAGDRSVTSGRERRRNGKDAERNNAEW